MQDSPDPEDLIQAVAKFLREQAGPALGQAGEAALGYQARVAANMLDIARRQLLLAPAAAARELTSLQGLLGQDGDLAGLNQALADGIASGVIAPDDLGLAEHLWASTLAKLAVDQPGYETYRRLSGAAADKSSG
jgi:hypothetical protein